MTGREAEFKTLSEVGSIGRGKSKHRPRNDPRLYGGQHPFVQTSDVKHAGLHLTNYSQTYSELGLAQSKLWPAETLCITIAANIGDTAILGIPACFPDSILGFVADPDASDVRYVKYCLDGFKEQIQLISRGTTQDNLSLDKLLKLRFWFPNVQVQEQIAAILSAYDDLIANNQRRIALLESMAEEIYREWFVRMRFPEHETTTFEKGLPHGWGVRAVSELLTEQKRPIKRLDLSSVERYVGLEHIPRKSIALNDWGSPEAVESDKLRFAVGDILFGKIRPYLHKVALANFDGACSTDIIVLRPKSSEVRAFGLFTVFSTTFIDFATTASKGTKMPRADWHYLKCLEIRVPSQALLQRFEKTTEPMLAEVGCLLRANQQLSAQRDALLPRLISGKLKVDHLDIQLPPSMRQKVTA